MDYTRFTAGDFTQDDSFIRWVKGSDPAAAEFWETFLLLHPEKRDEVEEARRVVGYLIRTREELADDEILKMRRAIMSMVHESSSDDNFKKVNRTGKILRWAAMLGLPLALFTMYYLLINKAIPDSKGVSTSAEQRVNPKGQKSVILLSDGTKVSLNADSHLRFDDDFGSAGKREVFLEGEAFFDVAKNASKPFIVRTSKISIQVLGTAFNVKSYPADKTIETTLVHGKVSIRKNENPNEALILAPNQRAVYNKESATVNVDQVIAERAASWRYDKLIFDETPFYEVIAQLERWYNVNIHVEKQVDLSCSLTANIEDERLEDVLSMLQISHKIKFRIEGKDVFLEGALCK